jgi:hypothetical protein
MEGLEGAAAHLAEHAREVILERGYRLNLHFATLGRCSGPLEDEAKRQVRKVDIPASQRPRLTILTGERVIKASDLRANDRLQVGLERSLHQLGYCYQRKRAAPTEMAKLAGQHEWKVTKEALAKAVIGCESAFLVRRGTDQLFEEPRYRSIFNRAPRQLLCCWWLSRSSNMSGPLTSSPPRSRPEPLCAKRRRRRTAAPPKCPTPFR